MVVRLRPCMRSSTSLLSSPPPLQLPSGRGGALACGFPNTPQIFQRSAMIAVLVQTRYHLGHGRADGDAQRDGEKQSSRMISPARVLAAKIMSSHLCGKRGACRKWRREATDRASKPSIRRHRGDVERRDTLELLSPVRWHIGMKEPQTGKMIQLVKSRGRRINVPSSNKPEKTPKGSKGSSQATLRCVGQIQSRDSRRGHLQCLHARHPRQERHRPQRGHPKGMPGARL